MFIFFASVWHRFWAQNYTEMFPRGGPGDAREGAGMPSGEGFGKNTKEPTFWDPHGAPFRTLWVLMGVFRATFWRPNRVLDVMFLDVFRDLFFISFCY